VIRVLLAEDETMMLGALALLLALEPDIEIVAQAGTGDGILPACLAEVPLGTPSWEHQAALQLLRSRSQTSIELSDRVYSSRACGPHLRTRPRRKPWTWTRAAAGGFAFAYGRVGRIGPRVTALAGAAGAFVSIFLVRFLEYRANPPSVGQTSTLDHRTEIYFGLILISVLTMMGAIILGATRLDPRNAALVAAGAFIAVTAAVYVLIPGLNEVPAAFPDTTLWHFMIGSLATQLTLWTTIGLAFGAFTERSRQPARPEVGEVPLTTSSRARDASGPAGEDVVAAQRLYLHDGPGVGGGNYLAATDVHGDVGAGVGFEYQVAWLQVGHGDVGGRGVLGAGEVG
jgi:hypothetical protein